MTIWLVALGEVGPLYCPWVGVQRGGPIIYLPATATTVLVSIPLRVAHRICQCMWSCGIESPRCDLAIGETCGCHAKKTHYSIRTRTFGKEPKNKTVRAWT